MRRFAVVLAFCARGRGGRRHNPGGQAPPLDDEGVKANARGINFNKHVTGDNLLVKLP